MTLSSSKSGLSESAGLSERGAIGFALAGFTFWVFTDTTVKLVGQSGLPAYEMVAFLGLSMAMFMAAYAGCKRQWNLLHPGGLTGSWRARVWIWPTTFAW